MSPHVLRHLVLASSRNNDVCHVPSLKRSVPVGEKAEADVSDHCAERIRHAGVAGPLGSVRSRARAAGSCRCIATPTVRMRP